MGVTTYEISKDKTYRWNSYGHVALVKPTTNYNGTNPDEQIRVKVQQIVRMPEKSFGFKVGDEIPVFAEELTAQ